MSSGVDAAHIESVMLHHMTVACRILYADLPGLSPQDLASELRWLVDCTELLEQAWADARPNEESAV